MTVYVVATTARPTIMCPSWCEVSQDEHVAELADWEGRAVHRWHVGLGGDAPSPLDNFDLSVGVSLNADGTAADGPVHRLSVMIEGRDYTPAQALLIAETIKNLVHDVTDVSSR